MEKVGVWWGYLIIHDLDFMFLFFPIRQTKSHMVGREIWITKYFRINNTLTKQYWSKDYRRISLQNCGVFISGETFFFLTAIEEQNKQRNPECMLWMS